MFNSMQPTLPSHALAEYVLEPLIDSAQKNVINPNMHITDIGLFILKSFSTGVVLGVQTYLVVAETVVCVAITILSSTSYMITLGNVEIFRKISVLSFSASATSIASLMLPFVRISLAKPNLDHIYKDLPYLKDMKWGVFNTTNALSKAAIRTLFGKVVDDTDFFTGALASLYDMCLTEGSFAKAAFLFSTPSNHHINRDSLTFLDLISSQYRWVHAMRNESANAAALLDQSPIADYPGFTDACFDLYCKKYTAVARNPNELLQQLSNLFSEDPALKREARSQLIGHFLSNSTENMNRLLDSTDADQIFDLILQISDPAKAISNIQNHIQRHPDSPLSLTVAQSLFTSIPLNPNLAPITYQP
ncbi:MAG: hypothetical protein EBZ47_08155, partial [Chlamydiae bacterium]|nr:hypothetical protein [Chlamydiota bacterium]